ncbi:MAG: hypothetical protein SZ59_C0001G0183 [candidate division TM6 bacterium GW2011_GWF2_28_16]|nr:MAG: hypothetical protein SZ59_C0001G0183 [candidate division TM6 bacterium GW2011_GWF2_28_16]
MDKKLIVRSLIIIIFGVFVIYAIFLGQTGLGKYLNLKKEIDTEKKSVKELENKISKIENDINKFKQNSFEVEKTARLDLQMGEKDEVVYLLDK